jgi:poly(hydroxyalkanoate) depolymerase family esterase
MKNLAQRLRLRRGAPKTSDPLSNGGATSLVHRLFVPDDVSRPLPLVVALHGCKQTAADFATGTRFDKVAAAHGAIVLYPQQSKAANASGCWNWFLPEHQTRERGEPAAILRLVDEVSKRYPIDPNQRYVVGLSAGGAMAAILGEQAPDVFAGVGIMAGVALHAGHDLPSAFAAMAGKSSSLPGIPMGAQGIPMTAKLPASVAGRLHPLVAELSAGLQPVMPPVPGSSSGAPTRTVEKPPQTAFARIRVMIWSGTDDRTVAPQNATALSQQYCDLLGLDPSKGEQDLQRRDAEITQWRDAVGRVRIEMWSVTGMGHAWSGGSSQGSFTYPGGPDASTQMLRFFGG